jgi:predicted acetyltransferase
VQFPTHLNTERLELRQLSHEDWPALHEHYSDLECTRFTFRRALSEGESWRAMASMAGHWNLRGYGPFAAVERSSGQVIGAVGLWAPNDWPEPEIKWALRRRFWRKGYASEAVRAIQVVSTKYFEGRPPISPIAQDNEPSQRFAMAVGATLERVLEFRGAPWHQYRHPLPPPSDA